MLSNSKESFKDKKGVNAKKRKLINMLYTKVGKRLKLNLKDPKVQNIKDTEGLLLRDESFVSCLTCVFGS